MNRLAYAIALACAGVLLTMTGCGRSEIPESDDTAGPTPSPSASRPAASSSLAETKQPASPAAADLVGAAVDKVSGEAQALIDQTKSLLSEMKYQDATETLGKLASLTLNDEQEALVGELKTELQTLVTEADKKVGEFQTLVEAQKYDEAAGMLQQLSDIQFSPDQQELVDRLKAELKKAYESKAAQEAKKLVGGLLDSSE